MVVEVIERDVLPVTSVEIVNDREELCYKCSIEFQM